MQTFISILFFLPIVAPLLVYVTVFTVTKQLTKKHRQAVTVAMDSTTFFLVLGVTVIFSSVFQYPLHWWSLLFFLFLVIVFAIHQRVTKIDIVYPVIFRRVWRMHFLLYGIAHFALLVTGIIFSIQNGL